MCLASTCASARCSGNCRSPGWVRRWLPHPQQMQISNGKRHPRRAPKPRGEVYRRFDARLGSWVSLRTLDIEHDLERFNRWQNDPRVEAFWQERARLPSTASTWPSWRSTRIP